MMMDTMFDLPSRDDVAECVVTSDTVKNRQPLIISKQKAADHKTTA